MMHRKIEVFNCIGYLCTYHTEDVSLMVNRENRLFLTILDFQQDMSY